MAGRAPFRAQRRFPPKGTYCWLSGKLSVFSSCLRCFSLKMEWTVFKKSFLLSGELQDKRRGGGLLCNCTKQHPGWVQSRLPSAVEFNFHLNRSLPTAQLKGPFWSSLWLRLCVHDLTHSWGLTIWERKQLWCYMRDMSHTAECSNV